MIPPPASITFPRKGMAFDEIIRCRGRQCHNMFAPGTFAQSARVAPAGCEELPNFFDLFEDAKLTNFIFNVFFLKRKEINTGIRTFQEVWTHGRIYFFSGSVDVVKFLSTTPHPPDCSRSWQTVPAPCFSEIARMV